MEQDESTGGSLRGWARGNPILLSGAAHIVLFAVSWALAFGFAYNFRQFDVWVQTFFLPMLPVVVGIKFTAFAVLGVLRGSWRYVSMRDVLQVTKASWWGFVGIFVFYYTTQNLRLVGVEFDFFGGRDFPDSVLLLDFAGSIAMISGARLAVRLYHEEIQPVADGAVPKLLILGAGNAGENVVREINRQPTLQYRIAGFLDDDRSKHGSIIHGVEVLGSIDQVKVICSEQAIDEILIAMPSATKQQLRRVVDVCQGTNLRFKTLPALTDLIAGRAQVQQIRDVEINDLLGRAPVQLAPDQIGAFIANRIVMVTGAGGSIGSEMCRQIAVFKPRELLLVEQAEQNLFEIDRELRSKFPGIAVLPFIADIADAGRMEAIFSARKPTAVFHAAAHKHVPMMEDNPGEAVKNNVRGTMTVAAAASRHGCEKFVMISTDKAVNPTSIMGGSKRLAEMYIQALNDRVSTEFITVRFGNVLGSSGSVVPIFKDQIRKGGPVTVTHPEMVRYFMTIPEAAQLVLQSASMGKGGEIFVLDMGEPVKIVDLARDLITLSGFRPDEDIEIVYTGMRPGEKLYEELSIAGEDVSRTAHPKIGIWQHRTENWDTLVPTLEKLISDADGLDRESLRRRLKTLVPEFYLETPPPLANGTDAAAPAPKRTERPDPDAPPTTFPGLPADA